MTTETAETSEGAAPSQAPAGAPSSEASSGGDTSALLDPWASVPLQAPTPTPSIAPPPGESRATSRAPNRAPLLDPWAGAAARHRPRQLDPELRDPFLGMRLRQAPAPQLHFAMADLRDPFARRAGSRPRAGSPGAAPEPSAAGTRGVTRIAPPPASSGSGMPLHPDLRDPFGRRNARPTPPAPEAAPAPRPPATPPAVVPPASPRAGSLGSQPFAHPSRTARPA